MKHFTISLFACSCFSSWKLNLLRLGLLMILGLSAIASTTAYALEPYFADMRNLAIRGYDPVAYFTESKPVEGLEQFEYDFQGATWRFSNEENMNAFIQDAKRYLPQYGGYCAWAVSRGYTASTDPHAWQVYQDKLYLNYNRAVAKVWALTKDKNIKRADENWPGLLNPDS